MHIKDLTRHDHVLVGFDGAVAQLPPAPLDVDRLRVLVGEGRLPREVARTGDPAVILDYAATIGPATGRAVHTHLCWLENEAVMAAPVTPGVDAAFESIAGAGTLITVVSGLSSEAVRAFLVLHGLAEHVRYVAARVSIDYRAIVPPAPDLITAAIHQSAVSLEWTAFVGNAEADFAAARIAGVTKLSVVEPPVYWGAEDAPAPPLPVRRGTPSSARPGHTA